MNERKNHREGRWRGEAFPLPPAIPRTPNTEAPAPTESERGLLDGTLGREPDSRFYGWYCRCLIRFDRNASIS